MISSAYLLHASVPPERVLAQSYVMQSLSFYNDRRLNEALNCMYYAALCDPSNPAVLLQYANMLRSAKQLPEALQVYKVAAHYGVSAEIHIYIGQVLEDLGQLTQALTEYCASLNISETPLGFSCKANLLYKLGNRKNSAEVYALAVCKFPHDPQLLNSMGNIYLEKQALKEAFNCYSQAVHYSPYFVPAICNLSSVLRLNKQNKEAIEQASRAMLIDRNFVDAYICLGNALKDEGKLNDAVKCYEEAVKLSPKSVGALSNLGNSFKEAGLYKKAISCYHKVVEMSTWCPEIVNELVQAKLYVCDWRDLTFYMNKIKEILKYQLNEGQLPAVQPFHCFTYPIRLEDKLMISHSYAEQAKARAGICKFNHRVSYKKLRVGYVSSDFCNHPLAHLMQSVFGLHDFDNFDIILFSLTPDDGSVYRRKIASEALVVDLSSEKDDVKAAQIINSHQVDILINLNGYTKGARNEIFALQPAPVQVAYMGFPGTLGASYIQFMIADQVVVPLESAVHYSEKMIYMPHSYFVNDYAQSSHYVYKQDRPQRHDFGLPEDCFVFACFNQLYKIDEHIFKVWMSILKRVHNSVLWLLCFPPQGEEFIKQAAVQEGVPEERIIFTDTALKDVHINRCYLADLVLDTPLCNGHTTTCDALWSGAPVLTLPLEALASRVAASCLTAAGCTELIASDAEAYEETAVRLATASAEGQNELPYHIKKRQGSGELKKIRHKIEVSRSSPLFNTKAWVQAVERGLKAAYSQYQRGQGWSHISVS